MVINISVGRFVHLQGYLEIVTCSMKVLSKYEIRGPISRMEVANGIQKCKVSMDEEALTWKINTVSVGPESMLSFVGSVASYSEEKAVIKYLIESI